MAWAPDYATAAELAAFKRIGDSDDNTQLALAIAAASRAIDRHCHRQFGQVDDPEERFYPATWDRRRRCWVVVIDDLMDDDLDITNDDGDAITDYTLEPRNAAAKGKPWERLVISRDSATGPTGLDRELSMTGPWGWTQPHPDAVKEATLLQASRLDFRRSAPAGVAGSPEGGSEVRLLARVDPDVAVSLRGFVRWWAAR